jgi:serine/threonine protein kinase
MDETDDSSELLDRIIDEYLADLKGNRHPTLGLYQSKYPEYAEKLAELLPLVASLHQNTLSNPSCPTYWPLKPGSVVDHYEILCEIGRGGMGIVYQAKQLGLDRIVALKVLIVNPADTPLTQYRKQTRFLQEAKLCSTLYHPSIIPIIQHGTAQGYCFYSMKYIDGKPLSAIIAQWRQAAHEHDLDSARRSKAHWHQIAQWMHDAAEALETAHQRRILHRDIKPSNLIVDSNDKIWLGDFGLAKDLSLESPESTSEGIGTVQYMSPEALVSYRTEKSDIYGLGITLYELLAWIPKYPKDTPVNLLRRIQDDDAPSLKQIDPRIPQDLITITQKATALLPSDRYTSAAELRDDLGRFLKGQPILARTSPFRDRCRRWVGKHQILVTSLAATAIFLILTTLLASYFWIESQRKNEKIELARRSQIQSFIDEKVASAHRTATLGNADSRSQAIKILNEAKEPLKDTQPNADVQRAITDILSIPELKAVAIQQAPEAKQPINYACDRDHRRILFCEAGGYTHLHSMADWNRLHTFDSIHPYRLISMSPDGRFATLGFDEQYTSNLIGKGIECWDLTTSPPRLLWRRENLSMAMGFWNASSDTLYCMEFDGTILGLTPNTNEIRYRLEPSGPLFEAILYPHPTLPILAVASHYFPEIHFRELETGATVTLPIEDRIQSFSWHPSGTEFATTDWYFTLRRIQWPTGDMIDELEINHKGGEVQYSPDGKWLAVSYWDHQVELFNIASLQRIAIPWVWTFFNLYWSSDSRSLAINVFDKEFYRLGIESPGGKINSFHIPNFFEGFHAFTWDPKNQLLLANSLEGKGRLSAINLIENTRFIAKSDLPTDLFFVGVDNQGRYYAIDHAQSLQLTFQSNIEQLADGATLSLSLVQKQVIPAKTGFLKMSGDGSHLFAQPSKDQIVRWPIDKPDQFSCFSIPISKFIDFSDTGNWIAFKDLDEDKQWLIDCQNNQKSQLLDGSDDHAFFSKQDELVFLSPSNRIYKFGQWEQPIADLPDADCEVAIFSADSKLLVRSDTYSQDVIVHSLGEKKDIFRFHIKEGAPKRMWLSDDNTQLIVCVLSTGFISTIVLDFEDLHNQANTQFPEIPYVPKDLRRDTNSKGRIDRSGTKSIRHIQSSGLEPNPTPPTCFEKVTNLWTRSKLDADAILESLSQQQLAKSARNHALIEDWDKQVRSDWGILKLHDIAEALANSHRFEDAIEACDLSLEKQKVNLHAKIIKAYSLWQKRCEASALETLNDIQDDLAGVPDGDLLSKTLRYQIETSMYPERASDNQAFLRAFELWTRQHPMHRLCTMVDSSIQGSKSRNLHALNLALANELIAHGSKIPHFWLILAQAKLQVGDTDGARQAIQEFAKLKTGGTFELTLKTRSNTTSH